MLSYWQAKILRLLQIVHFSASSDDGGWVSPTEIGDLLASRSSAWASPKLKVLVRMGLAERNKRGHYRAKELPK